MPPPPSSSPTPRFDSGLRRSAKLQQESAWPSSEGTEILGREQYQEQAKQREGEDQDGSKATVESVEAEQTSALARHMDSLALATSQPAVRLKRNRERARLGIPLSTSKKDGGSSPSTPSSATSPSKPTTRQTRQMSVRGAQKRLSVLPGPLPPPPAPHSMQPVTAHNAPSAGSRVGVISNKTTALFSEPAPARGPRRSRSESTGDHIQNGGGESYHLTDSTATSTSPSSSGTGRGASTTTISRESSASVENDHVVELNYRNRQQSTDDSDYVAMVSKGSKRRAKSQQSYEGSLQWIDDCKRTRSSSVEAAKNVKAQDHKDGGKPLARIAKKKSSEPLDEKKPVVPKGLYSVTGDEYALKHNNDYCACCLGFGQFICCDSCPKAFHFSCCQPPMDPQNLPDEWSCNECRAQLHPPRPHPDGIFKGLLDDIDRRDPKSFSLPAEIRTYFKGVETNSDGEYVDTLDYKPSERGPGSRLQGSHGSSSATEDPLQIRDKHGGIRICFHCNKSAYGGKMMISCEHCPLHWHLDCLNPPLASRPPTTRKWMCPNHADHVLPRRRRKRRDAVPVQAEDPFAPNDGDIEIIEETLPLLSRAARVKASLISDPTGALFRIPERSIKLGFLEKCQRLQQPPIQDPPKPLSSRDDSHRFEILVAVVMACEGMTADTASNGSAQEKEGSSSGNSLYEGVQNAVLDQLADPEDRAAYSRFRALQRVVRENGLGTSGAMNGGA
ncbi:hypothetical protein EDD21DRAFT_363053 [Dissophora ornata]|nr:hypothetical protein EDD21DRAFT_363053 [Dissophora ornata]